MSSIEERALTLIGDQEENPIEPSIRPQGLDEYVGQQQMVESLKIAVQAAQMRDAALPHVLLGGPPGLGKTSMAYVLAEEMDSELIITSGPNLQKAEDVTAKLRALKDRDILLIDEVHRMKPKTSEVLYSALEDGFVEASSRLRHSTSQVELAVFTLIACTTHVGDVQAPLRDRMPLQFTLSHYSQEEIQQVLERSASIREVTIEDAAIAVLAQASRGTPRVANSLLFQCRDYALVVGNGVVTAGMAQACLDSMGIDCLGLNAADRHYLQVILRDYGGGPVGVNAIASSLGERVSNLEENIEPYLLRAGLLIRDRAGRVATRQAESHLIDLGLLE
ncbi:MAG: Holliday junction branch migration DNA helicase RuvB [Deltaproteobacteria bacterium]|nr:Holliday junction branch migration DNA helicase RuvB [Deltaproteobacteria bacterium]